MPLAHVGGLPRRCYEFAVAVDSRACVAVQAGGKPSEPAISR